MNSNGGMAACSCNDEGPLQFEMQLTVGQIEHLALGPWYMRHWLKFIYHGAFLQTHSCQCHSCSFIYIYICVPSYQ
jgi:hypothetical protein